MSGKKYYWLKLKDDFFKSKEVKKIRKIAGGDTYVIIFLEIQLLSLKNDRKILFDNIEENIFEEIALEIDEDAENVKVALSLLIRYGLVKEVSENEIEVLTTEIGKESDSAERVRKHRQKLKEIDKKLLQCNSDVTKCNTEIEIDIELQLDKEIDKKINKKKSDKIIDYVKTKALTYENSLIEFIEFRRSIKKPLTELGVNKIINQLTKWGYNTNQIIEVLDNSIMNNWQGIFQLKETIYKNNSKKIVKDTVYTETKDEYDLALEKILEGK